MPASMSSSTNQGSSWTTRLMVFLSISSLFRTGLCNEYSTAWTLSAYRGEDGSSMVQPIEGTVISASFVGDEIGGRVSGKSGCNLYGGSFTLDTTTTPPGMQFGRMAQTLMACEEDVMAQETAYMKLLEEIESYSMVRGDHLDLYSSSNYLAISFLPANAEQEAK